MKIPWFAPSTPAVGWGTQIPCPASGRTLDAEACLACGQACPAGAAVTGRSVGPAASDEAIEMAVRIGMGWY